MNTESTTTPGDKKNKDTRRLIYEKLESALQEFRDNMKKKRFEACLKKASRMFSNGLEKKMKKEKIKAKKKSPKKNKIEKVAAEAV